MDKFSRDILDALEESGIEISMFSNSKQSKLNKAKKTQG